MWGAEWLATTPCLSVSENLPHSTSSESVGARVYLLTETSDRTILLDHVLRVAYRTFDLQIVVWGREKSRKGEGGSGGFMIPSAILLLL